MNNSTQITLIFEGSPSPMDVAARLRFQAGLWEGMEPKKASAKKNTDADPVAMEADEDEDFEPKKTVVTKNSASKKAASFDDDEDDVKEEAVEDDAKEDDEDGFETAPAKKTAAPKAKKITVEDVNDACKARAAGGKRSEVLAILKKKFKTQSVTDLTPDQYPAVIAAMKV